VKLNWLGRATMNNALRSLGQNYSAYWLERLGGRVAGGRALEVGCGRGVGVKIILGRFGAATVEAFDLDPKMVECARRHVAACGLAGVQFSVGDVTCIQGRDATIDAVEQSGNEVTPRLEKAHWPRYQRNHLQNTKLGMMVR
jgi:ubiquinone/menaquinone biosynthesis C-methylase UbiE